MVSALCSASLLVASVQAWSHLRSAHSIDTYDSEKALFLRHCDFQAYATRIGIHSGTDAADSSFRVEKGPTDSTIRLRSEYGEYGAAYYFTVNDGSTKGTSKGRIILLRDDGSPQFAKQSSWVISTSGANISVLASQAPGFEGQVLTLNSTQLQGSCATDYSAGYGEGDAIVAPPQSGSRYQQWILQSTIPIPPPLPASIAIDASNVSTFDLPGQLSVGIEFLNHEITGFGLGAQMVFGESFEEVENGHSDVPVRPGVGIAQEGFIGCQGGRSTDDALTGGVSEMWLGLVDGGSSAKGAFKLITGNDAF